MNLSKTLHPAIYAKIDTIEAQMLLPVGKDAEYWKVLGKHTSLWNKQYLKPFLAQMSLPMIAGVGSFAALVATDAKVWAWAMLGSFAVGLGVSIRFVLQNRRTVSADELENLVRICGLDETEQAYVDAIVELDRSSLDEPAKEEAARALNTLLDAEKLLEEQEARHGGFAQPDPEELARLDAEIAAAPGEATATLVNVRQKMVRRAEVAAKLSGHTARLRAERRLVLETLRTLKADLVAARLAGRAPELPALSVAESAQRAHDEVRLYADAAEELAAQA